LPQEQADDSLWRYADVPDYIPFATLLSRPSPEQILDFFSILFKITDIIAFIHTGGVPALCTREKEIAR